MYHHKAAVHSRVPSKLFDTKKITSKSILLEDRSLVFCPKWSMDDAIFSFSQWFSCMTQIKNHLQRTKNQGIKSLQSQVQGHTVVVIPVFRRLRQETESSRLA